MSKLSAAIFAAPLDLRYEDVSVPEWGVTLRVMEPTADVRADLAAAFSAAAERGEGNVKVVYREVVAACVADPEDNTPVFTSDEAARLGMKEGRIVDDLANRAVRLAGLVESAAEAAPKDSPETLTDEAASTSLSG